MVVTIVVLLILAGITIMYVMGDNSIFKLAQEAKDKTDNAIKDEKDYFNYIENTLNEYVNGNGGGSKPVDRVDVSTITNKVDKNTPAKDSLGNPITIPEGFHVVPDGQDGVEYNYTGDTDYSKQKSKNTSLANTGTNNDKVCNIYDMASNTAEWTTETYTNSGSPCTIRGGRYSSSTFCTADRNDRDTSNYSDTFSFRPLIYVK